MARARKILLAKQTEPGSPAQIGGHVDLVISHDIGKTWKPLATWPYPQQAYDSGMIAARGRHLWVFALQGMIRSADGGRTFDEIALPTQELPESLSPPESLSFGDPVHGWLLADGVLYSTSDGGSVWRQVTYRQ